MFIPVICVKSSIVLFIAYDSYLSVICTHTYLLHFRKTTPAFLSLEYQYTVYLLIFFKIHSCMYAWLYVYTSQNILSSHSTYHRKKLKTEIFLPLFFSIKFICSSVFFVCRSKLSQSRINLLWSSILFLPLSVIGVDFKKWNIHLFV